MSSEEGWGNLNNVAMFAENSPTNHQSENTETESVNETQINSEKIKTASSNQVNIPSENTPVFNVIKESEEASDASPEDETPQGITTGPAVIASPEEEEAEEEAEEEGLQLGDRFKIISKRYGEVKGTIYYLDAEKLLRILPDGVSNRVYDFPLMDDDFDPELGLVSITRIFRGPGVGFAEQQGLRTDQEIITFLPDGSLGPSFTITAVNQEDDRIRVRDETGAEQEIDFQFTGIPLDLPFTVLQIQSRPEAAEKPMTEAEVAQEEEDLRVAMTQGAQSAEMLGEDVEFEDLGEFELPELAVVQEIAASEQVFPEITQKSELLADLVSLLDAASQRNPILVKRIRALVEMSSALKNSVVKRSPDGVPVGEEKISLTTLSDVLENRNVPLARPILDTKRIIQRDSDKDGAIGAIDSTEFENQIEFRSLLEQITESTEYLNSQGELVAQQLEATTTPRYFQALAGYFRKFPLGDSQSSTGATFPSDTEYFRDGAPDSDEKVYGLPKPLPLENVKGPETGKQDGESPEQQIRDIKKSLRRAHGPTLRPLDKGGAVVGIPADSSQRKGSILFPQKAVLQGALGATRTGRLWDDILRSSSQKTWMERILKVQSGVSTEKDAQKILHLSATDPTAIGVPFAEQLRLILQNLVPRGPGDLSPLKNDLGMNDQEPNLEQQKVISDRVLEVIASLRESIRRAIEAVQKEKPAPQNRSLQGSEFVSFVTDAILSQPSLINLMKQVAQRTPNQKQVDVAIVASMMKQAQDQFLVTLGKNPKAIERERVRFLRRITMSILSEGQQLANLQKSIGAPPQPNPCEHVANLTAIRKVQDDTERMALLQKFLSKQQGGVEDNWITCIVCNEHLLCRHEVLQIQQFLHPREKEVVQKQIVLDFAGGTQGRNSICRNCGLPIEEQDFDKSIEFDDEGRPMMGREVLVDKDAIQDENLVAMFGVPVQVKYTDITYETEQKTELYRIARVIADRMGVDLDDHAFQTIVDRGDGELALMISEADYVKATKGKTKTQNQNQQSSQVKIALVSALILLEVQKRVPDQVVKQVVEGCRPGFGGFPLVADADPTIADQSVGVNYLACIISGIYLDKMPWRQGFQIIRNDDTRKKTVLNLMVAYLKKLIATPTIQEELETKREYLRDTFGAAAAKGRPSEKLPANFLPRMMSASEESESGVKQPVIAEGARGKLGDILKADAWIRAANEVARTHAVIIKDTPFAETACCFESLRTPGEFWSKAALPEMPTRQVLKPSFAQQTIAQTPMIPRPLQAFNVTPSLNLAFRVFLQLCQKGPRVGLPHELGSDMKCDWCELEIPSQYLQPDVNKDGEPIMNEEQLRADLDRQGLQITEPLFQKLLDISHRRFEFQRQITPQPQTPEQILKDVEMIQPEPITDFTAAIEATKKNLSELRTDASKLEIQSAMGPLNAALSDAEEVIATHLGDQASKFLSQIVKESPQAVFEIMRSYFLVPAQRILSQYDVKENVKVQKYQKLSSEHSKELETILAQHMKYLIERPVQTVSEDEEEERADPLQKAQYKLDAQVDQVSQILKIAQEIRLSRIRQDPKLSTTATEIFLREILRVLLQGPLATCIDPNALVLDEDGAPIVFRNDNSDKYLREFFISQMVRYKKEKLSQNPTEVRIQIEKSREMEKQRFISDLENVSPEVRQVELIKKRLGIGRWAIGGTKLVYSQDADQWDKNREDIQRDYAVAAGLARGADLPLIMGERLDPTGQAGDRDVGDGQDVQFIDPEND